MATYQAKDLRHLARLLKKKERDLGSAFKRAAKKAARKHAQYLRRNMPVATSDLRDSVKAQGSYVIVDAPHAKAVERGSRPHWPPLEPLIEWVKLRGFQGLASPKQQQRMPGTTTAYFAMTIGAAIESAVEDGAVSVNLPEKIARAIQAVIAKRGTRPHWYMRDSVPAARGFLGKAIAEELRRSRQQGG
jgi:hypothetical protein